MERLRNDAKEWSTSYYCNKIVRIAENCAKREKNCTIYH